jgi:hypothetical protein
MFLAGDSDGRYQAPARAGGAQGWPPGTSVHLLKVAVLDVRAWPRQRRSHIQGSVLVVPNDHAIVNQHSLPHPAATSTLLQMPG